MTTAVATTLDFKDPETEFSARSESTFDETSFLEIPDCEAWLYQNPEALASVLRGLEQSNAGMGRVLSFAQFAEDEVD